LQPGIGHASRTKDQTLEEYHPIETSQQPTSPTGEEISSYLRRPVRTFAEAQQDSALSRRQFAEAEASARRFAKISSPETPLRVGGEL
jgi:hypothetical protein